MVIGQQYTGPSASEHTGLNATAGQGSPTGTTQQQTRGWPPQWIPRRSALLLTDSREQSVQGVTAQTTVLIADPTAVSRAGLSAALAGGGIARVIEANTVHGVEEIIASGIPGQLALVSLAFGDSAYLLIHQLRCGPWQRVMALAPTGDPDPLVAAVQAGASGVLRGRPGTPQEVPGPVHQLTAREIEVLTMVADGRSNKWIAAQLALSALTVKSHLARISRKLGTGDRSHLVAIALRAGTIS